MKTTGSLIGGRLIDDPAIYDLFGRARTAGVFQFESEGMRNILRRLKPDRFEDLVAINALYRPGPIGGGLIDDFIKRLSVPAEGELPALQREQEDRQRHRNAQQAETQRGAPAGHRMSLTEIPSRRSR